MKEIERTEAHGHIRPSPPARGPEREAGAVDGHTSIGSLTGRLEEVSVHGRHTAGLWPDRGGGPVTVTFEAEQRDTVKHAFGLRVEVSGRLRRNAAGQVIDLRARGVEILPDTAPPVTDLVGLAPNLTEGKSPIDHLRELRTAPGGPDLYLGETS